jgi:beta-galactosidase beta subunit
MADYVPKLVQEYEVRNSFTPPLEYNDISKVDILSKIEMIEDYISAMYFADSTPTRAQARIPALLLVMSRVLRGNPELAKKYADVQYLKLGDYEVTFDTHARGRPPSAYDSAKSWETMAHEMLSKRGVNANQWSNIVVAND